MRVGRLAAACFLAAGNCANSSDGRQVRLFRSMEVYPEEGQTDRKSHSSDGFQGWTRLWHGDRCRVRKEEEEETIEFDHREDERCLHYP